jgi:hypothetical protein
MASLACLPASAPRLFGDGFMRQPPCKAVAGSRTSGFRPKRERNVSVSACRAGVAVADRADVGCAWPKESSDSSWPLRRDARVRRRWDSAGQGLDEYVDAVHQRASARPDRRILMSTRRVFLAVGVAVVALALAAVAVGANPFATASDPKRIDIITRATAINDFVDVGPSGLTPGDIYVFVNDVFLDSTSRSRSVSSASAPPFSSRDIRRETIVGSMTHSPSPIRRSASESTATSETRSLSR